MIFNVGNIWYLSFVFGLVFGICIWSCIWSILWAAHERRGVVVGACYADIADHQVTGKSGGVQSKGEGKSGAKQRGGKEWEQGQTGRVFQLRVGFGY